MTWTADASSGTGPVEYRFFLYDAQDNAWTMVRDWSTDRQFTWTPSTSDYGSFLLQVWALYRRKQRGLRRTGEVPIRSS